MELICSCELIVCAGVSAGLLVGEETGATPASELDADCADTCDETKNEASAHATMARLWEAFMGRRSGDKKAALRDRAMKRMESRTPLPWRCAHGPLNGKSKRITPRQREAISELVHAVPDPYKARLRVYALALVLALARSSIA
jgi:hypothetical protein